MAKTGGGRPRRRVSAKCIHISWILGKAVKVDVKDNATRTYTKYKRDGSVKKTMTANKKGGVDIDKSKKLRAKNRRSKKGTTRY